MRKWRTAGVLVAAVLLSVMVSHAESEDAEVNVTWSSQTFIWLSIDQGSVDLGTVGGESGPGSYDPDTDQWEPLESIDNTGYALTNSAGGFQVTVSATTSGSPAADLTRFMIRGWEITDWLALDETRTLGTRGTAGRQNFTDIGYRYEPSWEDEPGTYEVVVTFTATTQ